MKRFDYKIITQDYRLEYSELENQLKVLGNEGWEIIQIVSMDNGNQIVYTLKREI